MTRRDWMTRGLIVGLLAGAGLLIGGPPGLEPLAAQGGERVFELRTYTAQPGKFAAMQARFRDHIIPLFKKHGLTLVGFWTHADAPLAENTLVYILAHESREAAKRNWSAFLKDPERLKVWAESEKDGPINLDVKSVFLKAIDFSPIK